MQQDAAAAFDKDGRPDHRERISTTVREIELMETDYKDDGFLVDVRYYRTPPGLSAIVVDEELVSVSWYHCYEDPDARGIVRVRGHLAPTITAAGDAARPLLSFSRAQFERVWATAEK